MTPLEQILALLPQLTSQERGYLRHHLMTGPRVGLDLRHGDPSHGDGPKHPDPAGEASRGEGAATTGAGVTMAGLSNEGTT